MPQFPAEDDLSTEGASFGLGDDDSVSVTLPADGA